VFELEIGPDETLKFVRSHGVGHEDIVAVVYIEHTSGNYDELHILND
jgi:hypothetical protein